MSATKSGITKPQLTPSSASPSPSARTNTGGTGGASKSAGVGRKTTSQGFRTSNSTSSSQCASPTPDGVKKLPPIKAPVGLAKGPDLTNVRSKIGSLQNVKHRASGGERKIESQKLEWNAKSRIGSLENATHKAQGGNIRVRTEKLEWKVASKVGSLDNVKHRPGGGQVKIFDEKYAKDSAPTSPTSTPTPGLPSNGLNGQAGTTTANRTSTALNSTPTANIKPATQLPSSVDKTTPTTNSSMRNTQTSASSANRTPTAV